VPPARTAARASLLAGLAVMAAVSAAGAQPSRSQHRVAEGSENDNRADFDLLSGCF